MSDASPPAAPRSSFDTVSTLWLIAKVFVFLTLALHSPEIVVVAYQQF